MLAAAAVLATAPVRPVIGTGVVGGVLCRRPRRTVSVGGIGICGMTRLRRARRNEPTLLGGPLRRVRAIGILLVRIHAAHYRRKGAAAQRNSCPVRLFFTKVARRAFCLKSMSNVAYAPLFLDGWGASFFSSHAKPQVTKCAAWGFLSKRSTKGVRVPHSRPILNKNASAATAPSVFRARR